jgi:hypothetical protein
MACGAAEEALLEESKNGMFVPVALSSYDIQGKRDGAITTATATLATEDGERVRMMLEIHYDPTPALENSRWTFGRYDGGSIRAESVDFAGGQGEGPSLGGVFYLLSGETERFRVKLPMRPVVSREWNVD